MATNKSQKGIIKLLSETDDKSLVCFLDSGGRYHCGYRVKTKSTVTTTIVCWENKEAVQIKRRGGYVLNFPDKKTKKAVTAKFDKDDFTSTEDIQEDEAKKLLGNATWEKRKIIPQVMLKSRTLVCYFTDDGSFVFGFGYENGSNVRMKCLIYNNLSKKRVIVNKTTHRTFVLAFPNCMADYGSTQAFADPEIENFVKTDFDFQKTWFNKERQTQAEEELKKVENLLREDGETVGELVSLFSQLDIGRREEIMNLLKTKENVENLEKIKKEDGKTTQMKRENLKDETDDKVRIKVE